MTNILVLAFYATILIMLILSGSCFYIAKRKCKNFDDVFDIEKLD